MSELIIEAIGIVDSLTSLIVGIALLVFFWGIIKFMTNAGDEKKQKEGKNIMVWGIVTLFVMISTWGIIQVLQKEIGLTGVTKFGDNTEFNGNTTFGPEAKFGSESKFSTTTNGFHGFSGFWSRIF